MAATIPVTGLTSSRHTPLLLVIAVGFVIGMVNACFTPEGTRALLAKGAALAFMMGVIALSLPENFIRRKVLKARLIATFMGVVATGILIVGFAFNVVP